MIKCDDGKFTAKGEELTIQAEFAIIVNGLLTSVKLSPHDILKLVAIGLAYKDPLNE